MAISPLLRPVLLTLVGCDLITVWSAGVRTGPGRRSRRTVSSSRLLWGGRILAGCGSIRPFLAGGSTGITGQSYQMASLLLSRRANVMGVLCVKMGGLFAGAETTGDRSMFPTNCSRPSLRGDRIPAGCAISTMLWSVGVTTNMVRPTLQRETLPVSQLASGIRAG